MLLLQIGVKTLCGVVDFLEIGDFCYKANTCQKQRAQLSCCSKLALKHSVQLSFCLKLATFVKKVKLVKNTVRNRPVAWKWRQNTLRNGRFAWNWRLLAKLAVWLKACGKEGSQLSIYLNCCVWSIIWKKFDLLFKIELVKTGVRKRAVARNWRQNILRNCRCSWNRRLFSKSLTLLKTPCATVLLLEIGVKALCATFVLLQIGDFC